MIVFEAVVVVEVKGGDAWAEDFEGFVDGGVAGDVGVSEVEGDAYVVEVPDAEDFEEVVGGGDFVLEVFEEDFDAEGLGEGFDVLDCGEGVFEGAEIPGIVFEAEVQGDGGEGDLLGGLEGAFDLVHGVDAAGLFGVDEIEGGGDVAGPVVGGEGIGEDGLVEGGVGSGVAEPVGEVADDGAVGVVEVVSGSEDFDGSGSTGEHGVEQSVVQALLEEDVSGEAGSHPN